MFQYLNCGKAEEVNTTYMDKITITTDAGERVEAVAPVIISASRATDIPAFYARWFFNRLRRGYCVWYNPFNRQKTYVSFCRCRVVVFWTKNPRPIMPYLHELDARGIHYYFQYTLNDYEREGFEPNVPPLEQRVEMFRELSCMVGRERVIWRTDPLIVTPELTPRELLRRIWRVGNMLMGCTDKLVFSFVDVRAYRKVRSNMVRETGCFSSDNVDAAELDTAQCHEIAAGLARMRDAWTGDGWNVQLATCAEEMPLEHYGIWHNRCIDGELMEKVFGEDKALVYYLRTGVLPEPDLFGGLPSLPDGHKNLKDKGQRKACGCMVSKDIGMYDTCRHFCVYCYANAGRQCVLRNAAQHSDWCESLIE